MPYSLLSNVGNFVFRVADKIGKYAYSGMDKIRNIGADPFDSRRDNKYVDADFSIILGNSAKLAALTLQKYGQEIKREAEEIASFYNDPSKALPLIANKVDKYTHSTYKEYGNEFFPAGYIDFNLVNDTIANEVYGEIQGQEQREQQQEQQEQEQREQGQEQGEQQGQEQQGQEQEGQ